MTDSSPQLRIAAELIPIRERPNTEKLNALVQFMLRCDELWSNWQSLRKDGIKFGGGFGNNGDGRVGGPGCGVEIHRLKGLYMDFRFFWAEGERTNFRRVCSIAGRLTGEVRVHKFLAELRKDWAESGMLSEWHGYSPDQLTRLMFNGTLFHADDSFKFRIAKLRDAMSDELAHHLLTSASTRGCWSCGAYIG
jgi:hypothetical protein